MDIQRKKALRALRRQELSLAVAHLRHTEGALSEIENQQKRVSVEVQQVDELLRAPLVTTARAAELEMACRFDALQRKRRDRLAQKARDLAAERKDAEEELARARGEVEAAHKRLKGLST